MKSKKNTPKEIKECRKKIASILDRQYLFVGETTLESPRHRYYFYSEDSSKAETGDRIYSVIPFYNTTTSRYWLGASVDVETGRKCYLKNVSLLVFEGEASSAIKTAAFRAEWDYTDPDQANPDQSKKHAQPHWHVYSVIDKYVEDMGSTFEPEPQVKEFKPQSSDTIRRFHFAMGSQWHMAKNSHTCQLDFDNLCKWLDGCVNYIRGQFDYLYSS